MCDRHEDMCLGCGHEKEPYRMRKNPPDRLGDAVFIDEDGNEVDEEER